MMFAHCPSCGVGGLAFDGRNRFTCSSCGFTFFQNTATGVGAILTWRRRILLLVRGEEPAKGMLEFPGGFVDPGESAEEALRREIDEEIAASVGALRYLTSGANRYEYGGVAYHTCDFVFTGELTSPPTSLAEEEVADYLLLKPEEIDLDRIAFPSLRAAMRLYLAGS